MSIELLARESCVAALADALAGHRHWVLAFTGPMTSWPESVSGLPQATAYIDTGDELLVCVQGEAAMTHLMDSPVFTDLSPHVGVVLVPKDGVPPRQIARALDSAEPIDGARDVLLCHSPETSASRVPSLLVQAGERVESDARDTP